MEFKYSSEQNVQILVDLLKAHNIRKVIVSPGATNLNFVASLQYDGNFELYSAVDERGAAYMAVGMAYESGEPVVITCTGATASRNYLPGLSEAYHRKLPVLAVTATQDNSNCGNLTPQYIDRSECPKDAVKLSINLPYIQDETGAWRANLDVNRALLELRRNGGGPVHINLTTRYENNFGTETLPPQRVIRRYTFQDELPEMPDGKVAITVGGHGIWSRKQTEAVDRFCAAHDAVVFTGHSGGYHGKYRVNASLAATQELYRSPIFDIDLLIHIGEQSGDYYVYDKLMGAKEVWRISEDGELRDTFRKLTKVFEMPEQTFFEYYAGQTPEIQDSYYRKCCNEVEEIRALIPELPFSNLWMAKEMAPRLPKDAVIHLGVSNTMRSWTFFDLPESVQSVANVGCRGIDGALSTALGMSLAAPERIHYCAVGDLTFFYNMNALGNRQVGNNLRILLVNNGGGTEFKNYQHRAQQIMGDKADDFVAAVGHNGRKSQDLVRHYAEDLGFVYLSASGKEEAKKALEAFLNPEMGDRPMLLEVFTESEEESKALEMIRYCRKDTLQAGKQAVKNAVKQILGPNGTEKVKKIIRK